MSFAFAVTIVLSILSLPVGLFAFQTDSQAPAGIRYSGGELTINVLNSTLAEVLIKVSAATGLPVDVPPEANAERMPVVNLGPGPARQVLADLLRGSNLDYLIQSSDADPKVLRAVVLMPRKQGSGGVRAEATRPARSMYARAGATPPQAVAAETTQPDPPPPAPEPEHPTPPSPREPRLGTQLASSPSLQPGANRPTELSPPAVLTPENIQQQLQQMYQQRMQMTQQQRQALAAGK